MRADVAVSGPRQCLMQHRNRGRTITLIYRGPLGYGTSVVVQRVFKCGNDRYKGGGRYKVPAGGVTKEPGGDKRVPSDGDIRIVTGHNSANG